MLILCQVVHSHLAGRREWRRSCGTKEPWKKTSLGPRRGKGLVEEAPIRLTSGKQERKGLMGREELQTLRLWSPKPRVTPMVAITRA